MKAVAGTQDVVMSDNIDFSNLRQHVQAVKERPVFQVFNIQLEQHSRHFYMTLYHHRVCKHSMACNCCCFVCIDVTNRLQQGSVLSLVQM